MAQAKLQTMTFSNLSLFATGGLEIISSHPNKMRLKGVLVRLDEPSTKPPNGSKGHKILIPSVVAQRRLSTLIGMGLNYAPSLDQHAQRRKVGVITKAWIDGRDLRVEGNVWKHDFPESETDLKKKDLGMSMEIGDVSVDDVNANVWTLNDFYFLGATVLQKDAAAYYRTQAIAARADERSNQVAKQNVAKKPVKKVNQTLSPKDLAEIVANAVAKANQPLFKVVDQQTNILAELSGRVTGLEINTNVEDEEAEGAVIDDMKTKKKGVTAEEEDVNASEEDEDEEIDAGHGHEEPDGDEADGEDDEEEVDAGSDHGIEEGDLEDMGPDLGEDADDDDEPGSFNKGAKNKGSKTSSEDKLGKNINKAITGATMKAMNKKLNYVIKMFQASRTENKLLKKKLSKIQGQVIKAAGEVNRRSLPADITGLLSKANINADDMKASGEKMTADQFDGVLANANLRLDVVDRIRMKTEMVKAGLMDEGIVRRGIGAGGQ